jgi:hypothetical protein
MDEAISENEGDVPVLAFTESSSAKADDPVLGDLSINHRLFSVTKLETRVPGKQWVPRCAEIQFLIGVGRWALSTATISLGEDHFDEAGFGDVQWPCPAPACAMSWYS